ARRFGEIDFSIKHAPYPQLPLEVALVEAVALASPESTSSQPDERPVVRTLSDSAAVTPTPPTSLRDRVRAPASIRDISPREPARAGQSEPAPITPLRSVPVPDAVADGGPVNNPSLDIEQIAELWPNVRADVKALNRRIEALLSEVDPVAISGDQITLAVPYPFHRDKLNSDDVRETVGGVLSRLLGRDISLQCILRSEMVASPAQSAPMEIRESPPPQADDNAPVDEEERARVRIRAAMNIFDAEEIREPEGADRSVPAADN
ncbi:MAG TPA: hypothetical protein VHG52_05310, partial [Thermomicrobiales bacterium]|nr:hypothetical protein [Thermomicrobiales bacterium]